MIKSNINTILNFKDLIKLINKTYNLNHTEKGLKYIINRKLFLNLTTLKYDDDITANDDFKYLLKDNIIKINLFYYTILFNENKLITPINKNIDDLIKKLYKFSDIIIANYDYNNNLKFIKFFEDHYNIIIYNYYTKTVRINKEVKYRINNNQLYNKNLITTFIEK